jgi:tyrosine aminotransferase
VRIPLFPSLYSVNVQLGDPTASGHLKSCPVANDAVQRALETNATAGYVNSCGSTPAREAVAHFHSTAAAPLPMLPPTWSEKQQQQHGRVNVHPDDVILANGCSGALELALTALLDPDTVLLVPQPGFPLYQVIAESHGASVLHYPLLPDRQWQVDMECLTQLVLRQHQQLGHGRIAGIVINNPSNPTGAVYSREHLLEILHFCHEHRLVVVADEVYGDMVFANRTFYPMATLAAQDDNLQVPVITASGIGKQFLLPGWRVGWIVFHDKYVYTQYLPAPKCTVVMWLLLLPQNTSCIFSCSNCFVLFFKIRMVQVCTDHCEMWKKVPSDFRGSFWEPRIWPRRRSPRC